MGRRFLPCILLLSLASGVCLAGEKRVYTAYRVQGGMQINGTLSSRAWQALPEAGGFRALKVPDATFSTKQTRFRIGWDSDALYIGVRCDEPDMPKIQGRMKDDDDLWMEDGLEIFLCPRYPAFEQLVITTTGSKLWVNGKRDWAVKTSRTADSWSAEVRVPFFELGGAPKDGDEWRFNIARNVFNYDSGGERFSAWADVLTRFAETENFAYLRFSKSSLAPGDAMEISRKYRAAATRPMMEETSSLTAECLDKIRDLKKYYPQRAGDPEMAGFSREAGSLQKLLENGSDSYAGMQSMRNDARKLRDRITALEMKLLLE